MEKVELDSISRESRGGLKKEVSGDGRGGGVDVGVEAGGNEGG